MISEEIIHKYSHDAQGFAEFFSEKYYKDCAKVFPINPFQVMKDLGIHFVFRDFKGLEGLYFPASDDGIDLVAINAKRPITRQRFTAAHELCHFLKDKNDVTGSIICTNSSELYIERYAEAFAAAFLMPEDELKRQIEIKDRSERLSLEDIVVISAYFGVSFEACYYRIKGLFRYLVPEWNKKKNKFKPNKVKASLGLNDVNILSDMLDAWDDLCLNYSGDYAKQVFKNLYVYNDARIEGVETEHEAVAEIISDLERNRQYSRYCSEENEAFCHIAGHSAMFDRMFDKYGVENGFSLYEIYNLNIELFSRFPYPEYGGKLRRSNTLVVGAKFETVDYREVSICLAELNSEVELLEKTHKDMSRSAVLKQIMRIHHRLTVIHPFGDGNGRTSRGMMNEMLMRYGLIPFYVKVTTKDEYSAALKEADKNQDYSMLYEYALKAIVRSHVELSMGEIV